MRVSTGMIFDAGVSSIQRQTSSLLHVQQQLSTGRRVVTPADDPVSSARALEVTQANEINTQYLTNQGGARSTLGLVDGQLSAVSDLIQYVRERAIQGGSTHLANSDRMAIAADLRSQFEGLVALANSTDGTGQHLFSGFQGGIRPFSGSVESPVSYAGDDGQRLIQVSASRQLPVSDSGNDVFMRIQNGNGSFVAAPRETNSGNAGIEARSVANPALLTGHNYAVTFSMVGSTTTYNVVDQTTTLPVASGAYVSGASIGFDGMSMDITGVPGNGDTFDVTSLASPNQSVFDTLADLITAIETPQTGTAGGVAVLSNSVGQALGNLDSALDNVLRIRATIGSRQTEVDALGDIGQDMGVQYAETLSRLQDVDYAEAISRLMREQSSLEAAQKSFIKVSGLSLFDYV